MDLLEDGINSLRREYYGDIRSMAEDLAKEIKTGTIETREDLMDRIHEDVDGNQWVIYTRRAQVVLLVSDNDSAGPDSLGAEGFDWKDGIPWSQLAYFAVEQDLIEALGAEDGIEINEDDLGKSTREAEAEEESEGPSTKA